MEKQLNLNEISVPIKGQLIVEIRDGKTGRLKSRDVQQNMFITAGKSIIAQFLAQQTVNGITYCAVGTGAAAPTPSDTQLGTETFRKQISVPSFSGNQCTFQTFFTTTDVIGTLLEAGLFGGLASATPNSATLFAKAQINRTKTANDTLTLTWTLTIG